MIISFNWQRCPDGYQIQNEELPYEEQFISPCTDQLESFNPLEHHSALLIQLAGIDTRRGFLQFASHNGLLLNSMRPEPFKLWKTTIKKITNTISESQLGNYGPLNAIFIAEQLSDINITLHTSNITTPTLQINVNTLVQAMWWQFINAISAGLTFEKCAWCHIWFVVGAGTGRRKRSISPHKSFCCPKHQSQYAYSKLKKSA